VQVETQEFATLAAELAGGEGAGGGGGGGVAS
jgi:hypothetical protein